MTAIQEALKEKGHDPGPVDGLMGPRTRAALREFQKAEDIEPTGRPDGKTLAALGVEPQGGGSSSSPSASPSTGGGAAGSSGSGGASSGSSGKN